MRDLVGSVTWKSDDYNEKYMKSNFYLDDDLPLNKTTEIYITAIVIRVIFLENNKHYLQNLLDEFLHKL